MTPKPAILFLCTGNSCRSQMAEGWARTLKGDLFDFYSAGTDPHGMNPRAVRAMAEAGIDISTHRSKHIGELDGTHLDYVITVCDHVNETCPVLPGNIRRIHVGFDDPPRLAQSAKSEEEAMAHYRRVRDEIKAFVLRIEEVLH